jgi:hypothetical protein
MGSIDLWRWPGLVALSLNPLRFSRLSSFFHIGLKNGYTNGVGLVSIRVDITNVALVPKSL